MTLSERLYEHIAAAFAGLWIQSCEHEEALAEIAGLCRRHEWPLAVWDIDRGLQVGGELAEAAADPVAAIKSAAALAPEGGDGSALLVLANFHRFLHSAEVVQALAHQVHEGRRRRVFTLVLSPVVQLPTELEKLFVVIEHELPDRRQLEEIAEGVATEDGELPTGPDRQRLLEAASGLTRFEAENAFALSLVRHGRLRPEAVWDLKAGMLKKSGLLTLHRGGETFADLGGLDAMKTFCRKALAPRPADDPVRARGILLLGVPGTGKSAFAKALGHETHRPTLTLDVGALMGSLVGQTEQNVRQALRIVDAMAPCILFCDELEKALAGSAPAGRADSGVSARLLGALLTWLSDHQSDVFFLGTCNDVSALPPEFSRAERFDGVFFLDLPGAAEKKLIWEMYAARFQVDREQELPADTDWTGAEIRSCCRLAKLLGIPLVDAARHIVPVAVTASEAVQRLRTWASRRCLDSQRPGIYVHAGGRRRRPTRRVARDVSAN